MADRPSCSKDAPRQLSETSDYDPCLDFYSDKFDPLKALEAAHIILPVPNAPVLDNLAKYEATTRTDIRKPAATSSGRKPKDEPAKVFERKFQPHQMPVTVKRKEFNKKSVLTQMETLDGPLSRLKLCVDERTRLKVWTRHSHGIRGFCLAFCVAFDKHWNLALEDVTEVWTRPRSRKVPALGSIEPQPRRRSHNKIVPPEVTIVKTTKKEEFCTRHVPQLIIRGEQVAYINLIKIS